MISTTTTVACGNNATFMRTTDAGITWNTQDRILGLDGRNFYSLSFLDENIGMICGDGGKILKTTDGGLTWNLLPSNTAERLNSIVVVDENVAIVVGNVGSILRTSDGGNSWFPNPFEIKTRLTSVRKLRPDFLTIVGNNGSLFKSVDFGQNWTQIKVVIGGNSIANDLNGQVFINDNIATLIGTPGEIVHTTDAGLTWTKQVTTDSIYLTAGLNQVDGKDPNILAAIGDYGTIISTTDGGVHWDKREVESADSLHGLSFLDKFNATAVGRDGIILRTSDGGITWRFLPRNPLLDPLAGVAFPKGDTSFGFAVGYYGTILRTTNGGKNWDPMQSGTTKYLKSVAFMDADHLFVVGDNGTMLRSSDAGVNWSPVASGTTKNLQSVCFPTPNLGWAVGDSGVVLASKNGGSTWSDQGFDLSLLFSSIVFPDSLHGYLGSYGFTSHGLYTTTDGGVTWDNPYITHFEKINGITAPSANVVSIVGIICTNDFINNVLKGRVWTSHDGGKTGIATFPGSPNPMLGIYFCDDLHGTVVGANGLIFHTVDGGNTWKSQQTAADDLHAVCFGNRSAGTAVGNGGQILRITTDD